MVAIPVDAQDLDRVTRLLRLKLVVNLLKVTKLAPAVTSR
jgi:hypothetical protein